MRQVTIAGKRFVVTGGAGHIGSAICRSLAEHGADVLCLSSRLPNVAWVGAKVCDLDDGAAVSRRLNEFGSFDGLIHCAGRAPRGGGVTASRNDFEAALRSTAGTAYAVVQRAVHNMPNGGAIVLLASMWGQVAPSPEIYGGMDIGPSLGGVAGAGAIVSLARSLAVELAPRKIRVNALVPGWFPKKRGPDNPEYMRAIEGRVPMGRIGRPEELSGPAMFLLSQASSYVTGQALVVDGGYSAR